MIDPYWGPGGHRAQNDNHRKLPGWVWVLVLVALLILAAWMHPALADDPFYQQMQRNAAQEEAADDVAFSDYMAHEREQRMNDRLQDQINGQGIDQMTGLPLRDEPPQHRW